MKFTNIVLLTVFVLYFSLFYIPGFFISGKWHEQCEQDAYKNMYYINNNDSCKVYQDKQNYDISQEDRGIRIMSLEETIFNKK